MATRVRVGAVGEFEEGSRKIVPIGRDEVGVFLVEGAFVASRNSCAHQGGPVCEGRYFPRIATVVADGGVVKGDHYDRSEPHLVCPWHGWEYDLRTGEFCADRSRSLRAYPVEIEGDDVYVVIG